MSLTDKVKNEVEKPKEESTISPFKSSQEDLKESISELIKQFKEKVASNKIAINDVKDMKDVVSIMQVLNDMGTEDSATPQINAQTANFIKVFTKLPDGTEPNATELEKASSEVKSDNLQKVLDEQANSINKSNSEDF